MKKIISLTLVSLLVIAFCAPFAYASNEDISEIIEVVEEANEKIQEEIDEAVKEADKLMVIYADNPEILDMELNRLGEELIDVTNAIAGEAIEIAAEAGVTVECELVEVQLGYLYFWIDPLVVAGW